MVICVEFYYETKFTAILNGSRNRFVQFDIQPFDRKKQQHSSKISMLDFNYLQEYWFALVAIHRQNVCHFLWNAFANTEKNLTIHCLLGIRSDSMHLLFCCRRHRCRSCVGMTFVTCVRVVSVWGLPWIFPPKITLLSYSVWNSIWKTIIQTTHEIRYAA